MTSRKKTNIYLQISIGICAAAILFLSPVSAQVVGPTLKMGKAAALAYMEENDIRADPQNLAGYAMDGNADAVIAMLASGVDANFIGSLPQSALFMASAMACTAKTVALKDQIKTMDALIASGANVNAVWEGLSILTMTAQQCPAVIVKRLLNAGAKIDARSPQGFTPLSMALIVGNVESATALVDAGARLSTAAASKLFDKGDEMSPEIKALLARAAKP